MKKLLLILLLAFGLSSTINFESSVEHMKIVNGDSGLELMAKASMQLTELIDLPKTDILYGAYFGIGFSQQYTAPRSSQFSYNHFGHRMDVSIGAVFNDIEVIYTHSIRAKYLGANPDVIFFNSDIDSIKLRFSKEFNL